MLRLLTSPNKLGLAVMLLIFAGIAILLCPERSPAAVDNGSKLVEPAEVTSKIDTDTDSGTDAAADAPAPVVDAVLVGQLARGMRTIKERRDHGVWGFCGTALSKDDQVEISTAIAYSLVSNMQSVGLDVDPWGILGTMYNESGFDSCALGLGPRKWAYGDGILPKPRQFVSHTFEAVLHVVKSTKARQRFATSGFDLGLCQVLTRFYPGQEEQMLTLNGGARICVLEMQARSQRYRTRTPWLFWRGSETTWYRSKVRRWARLMGAPMSGAI